MGSASKVAESSVGSLNEDIRALFEECLSKVRRRDSPASWKAIEDRIAALRQRVDQIYGEAPCSRCGAITELKVFEFPRRAALVWRLCDRSYINAGTKLVGRRSARGWAQSLARGTPPGES